MLEHKSIIVDFSPYTIAVFADSLRSGESGCPGIKLLGTGVAKESTKIRRAEE